MEQIFLALVIGCSQLSIYSEKTECVKRVAECFSKQKPNHYGNYSINESKNFGLECSKEIHN